MPVVSAGLSRNCLDHFGSLGALLKDAGFAGAVIETDSGEVWGIMASDIVMLARCSLFACWPVWAVGDHCGCNDCNKS